MNVHEWPLTIFTILAQMAVGAFVTLGFIQVTARPKFGTKVVDRIADPALYALGPLMVFGLAASVFHLGNPLNAPNAIRHVMSSWLSREILFGAGFAGLGFVFAVVQWRQLFTPGFRSLIASVTAAWGMAFIWVMAKVYMIRTVPAWDHWTTPASFYLTAGLLGILAMGTALSFYPYAKKLTWIDRLLTGKNAGTLTADDNTVQLLISRVLAWIGVGAIVLLVGQLIVTIFAYSIPAGPNPPVVEMPIGVFVLRLILLAIGSGVMALYLAIHARQVSGEAVSDKAIAKLFWLVSTSFLLVLTAEVLGRFLFYGTMNRIGI